MAVVVIIVADASNMQRHVISVVIIVHIVGVVNVIIIINIIIIDVSFLLVPFPLRCFGVSESVVVLGALWWRRNVRRERWVLGLLRELLVMCTRWILHYYYAIVELSSIYI